MSLLIEPVVFEALLGNLPRPPKPEAKHGSPSRPGYHLLHPNSAAGQERFLADHYGPPEPVDTRDPIFDALREPPIEGDFGDYVLTDEQDQALRALLEMEYETPDGDTLQTTVEEAYPYGGGAFEVKGHVYDMEVGLPVGEFERTIDVAAGTVTHDLLTVDGNYQGQGFGEAFLAHSEAEYAKAGIEEIQVSTGMDVGGYAWARLGFDWDGEPWRVIDQLENLERYYPDLTPAEAIERDELLARFESDPDNWPTPNEVAMFGHEGPHEGPDHGPDETWVGKALMLNSNARWDGKKEVRPRTRVPVVDPNQGRLFKAARPKGEDRAAYLERIATERRLELALLLAQGNLGDEALDWAPPSSPEAKMATQQRWLQTKALDDEAAPVLAAVAQREAEIARSIGMFVRRQRREVLASIDAGRPRFDRSMWDRQLAITVEGSLRDIFATAGVGMDTDEARTALLRWILSAMVLNASTAAALERETAAALAPPPAPTAPPPRPPPRPTILADTVSAVLSALRGEPPREDRDEDDTAWFLRLAGFLFVDPTAPPRPRPLGLHIQVYDFGSPRFAAGPPEPPQDDEPARPRRRRVRPQGQRPFAPVGRDEYDDDDDDVGEFLAPAQIPPTREAAERAFERAEETVGPVTALTLATGARHEAELAAALEDADTVQTKTWYSSKDSRVRPFHRAAHGQTVPLAQPFRVGPDLMMYPHDPSATMANRANCRCVMIFGGDYSRPFTPAELSPDPGKAARAASMGTMPVSDDVLDRQAEWLHEFEAKHGTPGDPGYQLLHPRSRVPDRPGTPRGALARDIAKREARSERSRRAAATRAANRGKAPKAEATVAMPTTEMAPPEVVAPLKPGRPRSITTDEIRTWKGRDKKVTQTTWDEVADARREPGLPELDTTYYQGRLPPTTFTAAQRREMGPAPVGTRWEEDILDDEGKSWFLEPDVDPDGEAEKIEQGDDPADARIPSDEEVDSFVEALNATKFPQGIEGKQVHSRLAQSHPLLTGAARAWVRENLNAGELARVFGYRGEIERSGKVRTGTSAPRPQAKALARALSRSRSTETLYRSYTVESDLSELDREILGETSPADAFKVGDEVLMPTASATRSEAFALNWRGRQEDLRKNTVIYRIPPGTQALNIEPLNPGQFEHIVSGKFEVGNVEVIDGFTYVDLVHTGDFEVQPPKATAPKRLIGKETL